MITSIVTLDSLYLSIWPWLVFDSMSLGNEAVDWKEVISRSNLWACLYVPPRWLYCCEKSIQAAVDNLRVDEACSMYKNLALTYGCTHDARVTQFVALLGNVSHQLLSTGL